MNCCGSDQCRGINEIFNDSFAADDLKKYRQSGPARETGLLLEVIQARGLHDFSLLDIGGGVGAIQHELAAHGARHIVNVDASAAYSRAARQEADRREYSDQVAYHVGDYVRLNDAIGPADVVTLDRVVCCYDDMVGLVSGAAGKARRVIGLVYPKDAWYIRFGVKVFNSILRIFRRPFRTFVHPVPQVEGIIRNSGFQQIFLEQGFFWRVVVFEKQDSAAV